MTKNNEGWTWLTNSRKWHYFRDGRSLCGKFMLLGRGEFEQGNDNSPDNCASCRKKLQPAPAPLIAEAAHSNEFNGDMAQELFDQNVNGFNPYD